MSANSTVVMDDKTLDSVKELVRDIVMRCSSNKSNAATLSVKKHRTNLKGLHSMLNSSKKWKSVKVTDEFLTSDKGKNAKAIFPKVKTGDTLHVNTEKLSTRMDSVKVRGGESINLFRIDPNSLVAHFSPTNATIRLK